jgi:hypothetical protein
MTWKRKSKFGTRILHVYGEATTLRVEPVRTPEGQGNRSRDKSPIGT